MYLITPGSAVNAVKTGTLDRVVTITSIENGRVIGDATGIGEAKDVLGITTDFVVAVSSIENATRSGEDSVKVALASD